MQLPCVIMLDDMFFAGIFTFLFFFKILEFKPKTNQKSKNHNKKHIVPNDNTRWLDI